MLALSGDQFMPWAAYDGTGKLRIGIFDRSYDPANHQYGYTLATETASGSLSFNYAEVTTARSDPTTGNRWFSGTLDQSFVHPTSFLGDYSNIAIIPGGGVAAYWTDLREQVTFAGRTDSGQDAFFGVMP